ncbi:hypothetical protein [Aporhodopirellula aestuarii]|uniref:Uncharacterized protein n=1 Tax=Aporhodopirellula aestuarii TaxID=2950107 RepID=A0ABT0UBV8_9BACT|nr:hypothetical protein [Aporhodopirellula aestuarii]MCM2374502.1 hypothetical protein [Aporhodopirellula aestuarii]
MSTLNVHWRHTAFSHDAGLRTNDNASGTDTDIARTGVLSDEHQEVSDQRPVLVEDATGRVYRASDLPPNTRVVVSDINRFADPIVEHAKQAGFEIAKEA